MAAQRESAINAYRRHDSGFTGSFDDPQNSVEDVDGETLETEAIRKVYPDLSNAVSQQLDVVSTELYSRELIERTKLDQTVENSGNSDHLKTIKVLNAALAKMGSAPSKFDDFLKTLEKCGFQEIAVQIRENYSGKH